MQVEACGLYSLVIGRRFELWVEGDHLLDHQVPLLLQLLACAVLPRVQPLALAVIDGLRRGGSVEDLGEEGEGRERDKKRETVIFLLTHLSLKKNTHLPYNWLI